jgi:ABC-type multidrug transport system ATPase subunit
MKLKCAPNKLNGKDAYLDTDWKITTLIWWNWSGKSSILQSIFSQYIDSGEYMTIWFSSWQNEWFSEIFSRYKTHNKRLSKVENEEIKSFYFDKNWIKILIFIATSLKKEWLVRKYLLTNKYIEVNNGDDISTSLYFKLSVYKNYLTKINDEYLNEQKVGKYVPWLYRNTIGHRYLEKLIHKKIDDTYDFLDSPRVFYGRRINFKASEVIDVFWKNINEIFTFLFHASSYYDYSLNSYSAELYFNDSLEFNGLSDGEYQLLSFYAMIDLFDAPNTLFIFDEIDSHLHYLNIKNVWEAFKKVEWNVITSTHNLESIIQNQFDDIRYIEKWVIRDDLKPKEVISKIQSLSSQQEFETQIAWRIQNIVLIDDELDWLIFRKLVKKKLWAATIEQLDKIVPIKRASSFNSTDEIFWLSKLLFANELHKKWWEVITKNLFLICDRDKLPLTEIDDNLCVKINEAHKEIKKASFKTYLLSWRRLEIENYLLHKDVLIWAGLFPHLNYSLLKLDDCEDIRILDSKPILKPLYKDPQFDEVKLDELIKKIPIDEISEDIVKMYNFISSKLV